MSGRSEKKREIKYEKLVKHFYKMLLVAVAVNNSFNLFQMLFMTDTVNNFVLLKKFC